jgi:hypothetical protein
MNIEQLKQFCAPAGIDRDNLAKPFTIDEHTYATDGHILVRIPGRLADPPGPETENAANISKKAMADAVFGLNPQAKNILLPKYEAPMILCNKCDGQGKTKAVECPSCGGRGEVELDGPYNVEYGAECVICEGAGHVSLHYILSEFPEKTSLIRDCREAEKLNDETCYFCKGAGQKPQEEKTVDLGDKRFRVALLAKLTGALENVKLYPYIGPGEDPKTAWGKSAYFIFDGGDGVLMPCRKEE